MEGQGFFIDTGGSGQDRSFDQQRNNNRGNHWSSPSSGYRGGRGGGGGDYYHQGHGSGGRGRNFRGLSTPRGGRGRGWGWGQQQQHHQPNSPYDRYHFRQPSPLYSDTPPFATSTPMSGPYRSQTPYFPRGRGRGGGGNSFRNNEGLIDDWISPQMWEDPWKEFTEPDNYTKSFNTSLEGTSFAESSGLPEPSDLSSTSTRTFEASSTSTLDVSDMIMRSELEADANLSSSSSPPLPNISFDLKGLEEEPTTDDTKPASPPSATVTTDAD